MSIYLPSGSRELIVAVLQTGLVQLCWGLQYKAPQLPSHCSTHCSTQGRFCSNTLTHSRSRRQGRIHHSICKIFKNLYRVEARCVKEQLIEAGQKCTKKYCRHIDTPMTVPGPAENRGATCISTEYILTTPDQTIPTLQSENQHCNSRLVASGQQVCTYRWQQAGSKFVASWKQVGCKLISENKIFEIFLITHSIITFLLYC